MIADEAPIDEAIDEGLAPPGQTRRRVDDDVPEQYATEAEPEEVPETVLTDEERAQFRTLLTIGKRTKKITVFDHPIVIRSLTCDDEIRIGLYVKDHRESTAFPRVYQCATVAAAIKSVDGKSWENVLEANPDPEVVFRHKYEQVVALNPLVVQAVYEKVTEMELEFAELMEKVGKV